MTDNWLVLPITIPLITAIISLFSFRFRRIERLVSLAGAGAFLSAGVWILDHVWRNGVQVLQVADWPAPFGITLVADTFTAIMIALSGIIGFAGAIYSLVNIDPSRQHYGYYPLYHFLLMGVSGAFLTGDLFNLYVWFEVTLMASFVLLALGGERAQMEGAIKYVTLNLLSSALFLAAIGILYGLAGTLNLADLALKFGQIDAPRPQGLMTTLAILFLIAFGIKAAIFPLFFWLPASYHTPPAAVSAVFAGLLTVVGVYALIRVFTLVFVQDAGFTHNIILTLAGITMVTGVLGAIAQNEFRRILSFNIVSQIGYMIMGLGLFTPLALAGSVYFIAQDIIVKTNLFLVSGVVEHLGKSPRLNKLGGFYKHQPILAILFLIPALSLAGIPPLSGFFAKFSLAQAGLAIGQYTIVAVALAVALLTLFSMMKIWNEVFWKPHQDPTGATSGLMDTHLLTEEFLWVLPIILLVVLTLMIGFGIGGAFSLAQRAGEELLNPSLYIQAVLGSSS